MASVSLTSDLPLVAGLWTPEWLETSVLSGVKQQLNLQTHRFSNSVSLCATTV